MKQCPVWWQIKAPRFRMNYFSLLPSQRVWNLNQSKQTIEEDNRLEESIIFVWPSWCQLTSFTSALIGESELSTRRNWTCSKMYYMLSRSFLPPDDAAHWHATCRGKTVAGLPICNLSRGYLHPLLDVLGGIFTPASSTWRVSLCVQSC